MLEPIETDYSSTGTRFKIFPQPSFLDRYQEPEIVYVSPPPGTILAGPSDRQMYVVDPLEKRRTYGKKYDASGQSYLYLPPYRGPYREPARPGPGGHFDHLDVNTRQFQAAHAYGSIRRVLALVENYSGKHVKLHFAEHYRQLEIVLLSDWINAQAGYGFIELGAWITEEGEERPYSLNFDVLAHEAGYIVVYALMGGPEQEARTREYSGFHEAVGDLVALLTSLHFDSVLENLLETSRGNLYVLNEANRIGELSDNDQVRVASNSVTMRDVSGLRLRSDGAVIDDSGLGMDEHDLAQPFTGSIFDLSVEVFQEELASRSLISEELKDYTYAHPDHLIDHQTVQKEFDKAYTGHEQEFKMALVASSDYMGRLLAGTLLRLSSDHLTYAVVAAKLITESLEFDQGKHLSTIIECLNWRGIKVDGSLLHRHHKTAYEAVVHSLPAPRTPTAHPAGHHQQADGTLEQPSPVKPGVPSPSSFAGVMRMNGTRSRSRGTQMSAPGLAGGK